MRGKNDTFHFLLNVVLTYFSRDVKNVYSLHRELLMNWKKIKISIFRRSSNQSWCLYLSKTQGNILYFFFIL